MYSEFTVLGLVKNCANIDGAISINRATIEIDQRISSNPSLANNGGDYNFWTVLVFENNAVKFIEKSSCELPMNLWQWTEFIDGINSFDDLVELVVNLGTNYNCQIVDNR